MLEKGFYACVIALVGIGLGTPDWMYTKFVINRFHDTDREFLPPVYAGWTKYANITVAPLNHRDWYEYFIDPLGRDNIPLSLDVAMTSYALELMLPSYLISVALARLRGRALALYTLLSVLPLTMLFYSLLMIDRYVASGEDGVHKIMIYPNAALILIWGGFGSYAVAFSLSPQNLDRPKILKAAFAMFKLELIFIANGLAYIRYFLPLFFRESTSELTRFMIRGVLSAVYLSIMVEVGGRSSVTLAHCGLSPTLSHLIMVRPVMMTSLLGRIMQGSANTVVDAITYEVAGTLAELISADQLLRGITPVEEYLQFFRDWKIIPQKAKNTMAVVPVVPASPSLPTPSTPKKRTKSTIKDERVSFCASTMIILQIAESASLLASSAFWLVYRINPAGLGVEVGPLSDSDVLINGLIMLAGEWIVADSIIAYVSHHWTTRYTNNVPQAWRKRRLNKTFVYMLVVIGALYCVTTQRGVLWEMCITSMLMSEQDWVIGQCPAPPLNTTEITRVGGTFT